MFQKLTIYRITAGLPAESQQLAEFLALSEFEPTTPNQELSSGFEPPRAKHGAFVEAIAGHWIARLVIETRKVPSDALQRRIDEVIETVEQNTGRKPGRKERRDIRDQCVAELLPQAFPKRVAVPVWIDPAAGLLLIGSTSAAHIDQVINCLVRSVPDLAFAPVRTKLSPRAAMAAWLLSFRFGELQSESFDVGRECELRADDESKAVVRYKNEHLEREEVLQHLLGGKLVTRLALTFEDRVAFVLTDLMQLKSIELLDVALEQHKGDDDEVDAFDGDVMIATGELSVLIAKLIDELGGLDDLVEVEPQTEPAGMIEPPAVSEAVRQAMAQAAWNPDTDKGIDPMIDRARGLVVESGKASISYIQRHLVIGYNRAARLLEALEIEGTVSAMNTSGQRDVLVKGGAS